MTIDIFDTLPEPIKVEMIFDANKISERIDQDANYQLFQIGNFYVESKTSLDGTFKRTLKSFSLKDLPVQYAGEILSIPLVVLDNSMNMFGKKNYSFKKNINLPKVKFR